MLYMYSLKKKKKRQKRKWAGIARWLERRIRNRKVASSNPGRSGGRIFFSRVNSVCWLLLDVRSTPVLLQWHVKKPDHFAKSAGGMHKPLTQRSRSELTMPLSRHTVKTNKETSSHATRREHSATVVSARWAIVDWSWPKVWNKCAGANFH